MDVMVPTSPRIAMRLVAAVLGCALGCAAHAAAGPSFDCARVSGRVTKMICASPDLSARDRTLAEHYRALMAQPGTDAADLQREEARWLHDVRDVCPDVECVAQAYDVWDALLVARSRRTGSTASTGPTASTASTGSPGSTGNAGSTGSRASTTSATSTARMANPANPLSPAAEGETRPFPVDPVLMDDARALRGKPCAPGEDVPRDAGYLPVAGSPPVIGVGNVVLSRQRIGAEFAVLLDTRRGCRMVDVVALPPHAQAGPLLQCVVPPADGAGAPLSFGIGLRPRGQKDLLAYWEVDVENGTLRRMPLGVLGWGATIRCRRPEFGD
jgi:uncharacterized protein YecT (DUF1311 family)